MNNPNSWVIPKHQGVATLDIKGSQHLILTGEFNCRTWRLVCVCVKKEHAIYYYYAYSEESLKDFQLAINA